MYSKLAFDEHLYEDPDELGEISLPSPVEENHETGRAKKMMFHELEVCFDNTKLVNIICCNHSSFLVFHKIVEVWFGFV